MLHSSAAADALTSIPLPPSLAGAHAPNGTPASHSRRVVRLLPWLLVSSGRLTTRELTMLASQQGLSRLLELNLSTTGPGGALAVKGQPQAADRTAALLAAVAHLHRCALLDECC